MIALRSEDYIILAKPNMNCSIKIGKSSLNLSGGNPDVHAGNSARNRAHCTAEPTTTDPSAIRATLPKTSQNSHEVTFGT